MIKKFLVFCLGCLLCSVQVDAQGSMTDNQVKQYVEKAVSSGKSQTVIAQELLQKGASKDQLQRLYNEFQNGQGQESNTSTSLSKTSRARTNRSKSATSIQNSGISAIAGVDAEEATGLTGGNNTLQMLMFQQSLEDREKMEEEQLHEGMPVYGRDIFNNANLDFAPNEALATPKNYRLGPGDEVVIDVYGANQQSIVDAISPEGSINVDILGPVYLNGLTIEQANQHLKSKLSAIYAGLGQDAQASEIRLTLGKNRSIQVHVLGDVSYPGSYLVSAFATAFHALYLAGGIKEPGSLRDIKVNRGGRVIATVDVYDFLLNGSRKGDVQLQEGDVIVVPSYNTLVSLDGKVKRPMLYEMKKGENLMQLMTYAGGFAKDAYRNSVTVLRQNGKDYEVHTVEDAAFSKFAMHDGDSVMVGRLLSRYHNRLSVKGAVYREGDYQLSGKVNSIKTLVEQAGGLLPEAFTARAVLHRENADRTLEVLSVDLAGILDGRTSDIVLKNNDQLYIPSIYDMKDQGVLTISGEVTSPGQFPFAAHTTLEDLIIQAGGLKQSASLARVDVSRRIADNNATTAQHEMARLYSFSVKDGFVVEGEPGFILEPYDEVYVRTSPSYVAQRNVSVSGEVNFTGTYPLTTRDERLSSLIQKCGGVTNYAYMEGARLIRQMTDEEKSSIGQTIESMASTGSDTLAVSRLRNSLSEYYVAIDLKKAMENPGGPNDLVLREGDRLDVPVYNNTVSIYGSVASTNVVTYSPGKKYKYYINEAGGYTDQARKTRGYIIYMNGHVSRLRANTPVLPGSQIVVPMRTRPKADFSSVVSSIGSIASVATSLATLYLAIKK